MGTEFNFRPGGAGFRSAWGEITMVSGTASDTIPFSTVKGVLLTQKDATAVTDGVSWSASGGTITFDSSNGSSTETYTYIAFGF